MKVSRLHDSIDHVTPLALDNGTRLVPLGTILMVVRGMSLAHSFPVAIAEKPVAFNQDLKAFVPNSGVDSEFLLRWLEFNQATLLLLATEATHGTKRIPTPDLLASHVPLPHPAEQCEIAEALSDVDVLLGALEALIAKKLAIKQAAMQRLLTGRCRLPGFTGKWVVKRIGDVADVDPDNLSDSTEPDYRFNYISLEQVEAGRLLGYTEMEFRTAPSRARRVLQSGDVLMSTVRPNLKGHLLLLEQVSNAICSTGFAVLRAKQGASDPRFMFAHLFGQVVNDQIEKILTGSNYPAISGADVRHLEIPCPPELCEQEAISDVLSDIDAEIGALKRWRYKTRAIKQGMMEQLLTGRVRLV